MSSQTAARRTVPILLIGAGLALVLYWPVFRWMFNTWISSDYYSYGFLVPLVSAFFIWLERERLTAGRPSLAGIPWLAVAVGLYVASTATGLKVLAGCSLICLAIGAVLSAFGTRAGRALAFPLMFLVFMVPLPFVQNVTYGLQAISVKGSSSLLAATGIPISTSGAEIHLGDTTFTVGLVCSGIDTLFALMALAAVYAYILKGQAIKRWGLFVLALPLAIGANVLRITSIITVAYFADLQTAMGWYHSLSSLIFFVVAFLILAGVGRLLGCRINYGLFWRS